MDLNISNTQFVERRVKPRIACNYPAVVKGHDTCGKKFEQDGRVINLSRGGAYALLRHPINDGDVLYVQIAFPTGSLLWGTPKMATSAVVVRSEMKVDGVVGIAIQFVSFKFL